METNPSRITRPAGLYTTIYVVDTGIHINHADFGGRAYKGANYAPDNVLAGHPPRSDEDYNGHGTSVAGLAAGFRYGAAKRALVVDVRIFNDNGSTSYADEIAGIDWAVNDASRRNTIRSSVMNLSFGGFDVGTADALSSAVRSAVNSGLFTTVASGNDRINAAYFTPANVAEACTIGGTDANDNEYYYSNYGNLVDLWAPGSNITAPAATSDFAVKQVYGTSFAAPLVAGVAAIFKSYGTEYTNYSPQEFCTYLGQTIGTKGVLTFQSYGGDFPGPNILLYDGSGA
ncbi:hypothetical protein FH972_021692 [Carpinus fangiana]|uniref:Peptidase S8/S53 domain-containing protein n=1 Tax=Carpinus fangiana TaxID=176857 RepID=A0A5N6KQE9_9ROSI|nr:hypothetical protein FH972_021692 [Carpinus fangiana]